MYKCDCCSREATRDELDLFGEIWYRYIEEKDGELVQGYMCDKCFKRRKKSRKSTKAPPPSDETI